MEGKNVKEAVSILYDMEIHNYKMTRAIQRLNYEISCLGNPRSFSEPQKRESALDSDWGAILGMVGVILGAILGGATGCSSTPHILDSLSAGVGGLIGGGFAGFCIGGLIGLGIGGMGKLDKDSRYEEEYEKEMENYYSKLEADEIRVENELKWRKILEKEREVLIVRRQRAQQVLSTFYMKVGIDKSFRSLIPISKMYEMVYFGITTEFYGENGLYDRVRRELREDAFYAKLDEISQKLDVLISKTDRLYDEIVSLNSQCETLISATMQSAQIAAKNNALLSEAVKNTEIAAYNSERIAAEERYQSFMMTYRY